MTTLDFAPSYRRRPRRATEVTDTRRFHIDIEKAMEAFQADVTYAVLMARAAVTITRKREVWQARREAKAAQG